LGLFGLAIAPTLLVIVSIMAVERRGGDAASGWVFNALGKTLGLAGVFVALTAVPAAIAWLYLSFSLSCELNERTAARDASGGQNP
jgi:hypothetical protein